MQDSLLASAKNNADVVGIRRACNVRVDRPVSAAQLNELVENVLLRSLSVAASRVVKKARGRRVAPLVAKVNTLDLLLEQVALVKKEDDAAVLKPAPETDNALGARPLPKPPHPPTPPHTQALWARCAKRVGMALVHTLTRTPHDILTT